LNVTTWSFCAPSVTEMTKMANTSKKIRKYFT